MNHTLRVTLIANAGLLLEYEGTTILLDSIYDSTGVPFSNLSPDLWKKAQAGEEPFQEIDYLLFTHAHPDHFTPELVRTYLSRRSAKCVFLPDDDEIESCGLTAWMREKDIPHVVLSDQTAGEKYWIAPNISVQGFRTLHIDKQFASVRHYCYILTFGEKRVLITADADYFSETFESIQREPLYAVFMNPMFFAALRNKRFFSGELHAQHLCIYHIPFAEDDKFGMRKMVELNM